MAEHLTRQDNFSLRLTQWLLDQLNTPESLDTVSDQLAVLLSQSQQSSTGTLCENIGQIIFQKITRDPHTTDSSVKLYIQLCHALFLSNIKRESGLSNNSAHIHEHVFRLCIAALESSRSINDTDQPAAEQGGPIGTDSIRDTGASAWHNPGIIPVERISYLVSELYGSGLISAAQVYECIGRLTTSLEQIEARLAGFCTLMEAHRSKLSIEPWEAEAKKVLKWATDSASSSNLNATTRSRVEAVTSIRPLYQERSAGDVDSTHPEVDQPIITLHSSLRELATCTDVTLPQPQLSKDMVSQDTMAGGNEATPNELPTRGRVDNQAVNNDQAENEVGSRMSRNHAGSPELTDSEEDAQTLIGELPTGNFDVLSQRIIRLMASSWQEDDGEGLKLIVAIVVEKLRDNKEHGAIYARLCKQVTAAPEKVSPRLQEEADRPASGMPYKGRMLFRKYLFDRCRADLDNECRPEEAHSNHPIRFLSHNLMTTRPETEQQALGLVQFIGELFKLRVANERIIHEFIKKLLPSHAYKGSYVEAKMIRIVCTLLKIVGRSLDINHPLARALMCGYFTQLEAIVSMPWVDSGTRSVLQEVIALRARNWEDTLVVIEAGRKNRKLYASLGLHNVSSEGEPSNKRQKMMK